VGFGYLAKGNAVHKFVGSPPPCFKKNASVVHPTGKTQVTMVSWSIVTDRKTEGQTDIATGLYIASFAYIGGRKQNNSGTVPINKSNHTQQPQCNPCLVSPTKYLAARSKPVVALLARR